MQFRFLKLKIVFGLLYGKEGCCNKEEWPCRLKTGVEGSSFIDRYSRFLMGFWFPLPYMNLNAALFK